MKKKNNKLQVCRLNVEFLRYTEMIETLDQLFSNDFKWLIKKLKRDVSDLKNIKIHLEDCLVQVIRQIYFIESFLYDCGVNGYEA